MMKWAIELGKFGIVYKSKTLLKGQMFADFVNELSRVS